MALFVAGLFYGLIYGLNLVADPARCGSQPMTQGQICEHYGKTSARLIDAGAASSASRYDLAEQIHRNQMLGSFFIAVGVFTIAAFSWAAYLAARDRWRDRAGRREKPGGNTAQPKV
jgi:hypothetical protein